jgi:hypothetical protein
LAVVRNTSADSICVKVTGLVVSTDLSYATSLGEVNVAVIVEAGTVSYSSMSKFSVEVLEYDLGLDLGWDQNIQ